MIFDGNWVPQSDNEYQQRLLALTMLLVKASGGCLIIPKAIVEEMLTTKGSMLHQTKLENGDIELVVTQHNQGVPS